MNSYYQEAKFALKLKDGKEARRRLTRTANQQTEKGEKLRSYCPRCCRLLTNAQYFVSNCFTYTCQKGNPWL